MILRLVWIPALDTYEHRSLLIIYRLSSECPKRVSKATSCTESVRLYAYRPHLKKLPLGSDRPDYIGARGGSTEYRRTHVGKEYPKVRVLS